jgi:hypothetical protein
MSFAMITPNDSSWIQQLAIRASAEEDDPELREAAAQTGGLPVYTDIGGVLVLMPTGTVVRYDPESAISTDEHSAGWKVLALTRAARKFPQLAALCPPRPDRAVTCAQCDGSGVLQGNVDCGTCFGTGWISGSGPDPSSGPEPG